MTLKSILLLLMLLPSGSMAAQRFIVGDVNERAVPCPDDPKQTGYKHVIDANVDQQNELKRIQDGEAPRKPYVFPFCNRFQFLMEEEVLQVLLDDISFICGYNGTNEEWCVFNGGDLQVNVPEGVENTIVNFHGISFYNFSKISTKAAGAASSSITFHDAKWHDFKDGATAVDQSFSGGAPMSVTVNTGAFENGVGGNLFTNMGGNLKFTNMSILENVRVDSMILSSGGTSTLDTVTATESAITRLTHTTGGAKDTVMNVKISEMQSLGSVLYAEGSGSSLTAAGIDVIVNKLMEAVQSQVSRNFNIIIATDGATVSARDILVKDNEGMDRIFSASNGALVEVTDAIVDNILGTSPPDLLSNVAVAEDGGSISLLRLQVSDVIDFSAIYFAACGSSIHARQSCVSGVSKMSSPAFVSFDSTFTSDGNYIDLTDLDLTQCRESPTLNVFKEDKLESSCFIATGTFACSGGCVAGFNEVTECQAGNPDLGFALADQSTQAGGANNPSCPASPPTPPPTLPPFVLAGGQMGASDPDAPPEFTATIPPGGVGGATGSGSSNNGGDIPFEASSGVHGSGAISLLSGDQFYQLMSQVGASLLLLGFV